MKTESQPKLRAKLFFTILALLFVAPMAHAAGINIKSIPPVKELTKLPEAQFNLKTKPVGEDTPYGEPEISYSMRVPSDWTDNAEPPPVGAVGAQSLNKKMLGIIGKYISSPKNMVRSYVTIEAQRLPHEISAENWFVNFILSNGFSLTALTEKAPRDIEAIYVQIIKDQTFFVRTRIVLNGPNLILVRYYLPQENNETDKAMAQQIIRSFNLTSATNERIEKQAQYGFLDQSYFNYPESWTLKEKNILSVERMSATIYQTTTLKKKVTLEGHIKVNLISRLMNTTLQQEIEQFRANLKIPKYNVGKMIEELKYDYDPSVKEGKTQVYELLPEDQVNMQPYEFVVTIMQGDDYYYIISMITPSREEDFLTWAQNMEAGRVVVETMRRQNVSLEQDPNDPYYDYLKQ